MEYVNSVDCISCEPNFGSMEENFNEIVKGKVFLRQHKKKSDIDFIILIENQNICLFEVHNKTKECFVNLEYMWDVFKTEFNKTDKEIQEFLSKMIFEYFQYENYLCNKQMF